ncbi:MAG TPA: hypothetical protein VJW20_04295 [Candidatus Angelobacter sp.]|nr:hypothetical protein [Candidatus Angelobacter sp.]
MASAFAIPKIPPILNDVLVSKTIPQLNDAQCSEVTHYLFKYANTALRLAIGEVAYRNHNQPHAFDLFLSCAVPLAKKWAVRKAYRLFPHPTDWQLECFYNGAVSSLLKTIQRAFPLAHTPDAFRRFLAYRFACGATEAYFTRYENYRMETVENIERVARPTMHSSPAEQEVITRDLLEKISAYPLLQRSISKPLECIRELGPDMVLKEHQWREERDPDRRKNVGRPILNAQVIAKARGVSPAFVHCQISAARRILQKAFNDDGRLFQTH